MKNARRKIAKDLITLLRHKEVHCYADEKGVVRFVGAIPPALIPEIQNHGQEIRQFLIDENNGHTTTTSHARET
jgi:hypothetical protein